MSNLTDEDTKLVTLARSARLRAYAPHTGTAEGAAVRDTDGRTYAAGTVEHADPVWTTPALRGALVAAASSGSRRFEAAAVVTDGLAAAELEPLVLELGVPLVMVANPDGTVRRIWTS